MSKLEWENVNNKQHSYMAGGVDEGDPNWLLRTTNQAEMFVDLFMEGVFSSNMRCVDYACGTGTLSKVFDEIVRGRNSNLNGMIKNYEKYTNYTNDPSYITDELMKDGSFDVVTTSSVFEHLAGKEQVDKVMRLLKNTGTFCLHTLVCEEVPRDPKWFYFQPVHCTCWTNKSMRQFYDEYKFLGCAYNFKAKMWLMFRDSQVFYRIKTNPSFCDQRDTWFFSDGFIDYYKNKPYR